VRVNNSVCRFRPIEAADVTRQSFRSSVVSGVDESHRVITEPHDVTQATAQTSATNRCSRTLLLPSPSSAFSVPPTRHNDTVSSTASRNPDADVPDTHTAQRRESPNTECRYRRRGTVKEMAQSYERSTQGEVSARRLSCTFRSTLPSNTHSNAPVLSSVAKPRQAVTTETSTDHYTTTSVFSLSKSRPPEAENGVATKRHETKLRRLYHNTVASLYKSLDNFARLQAPFVGDRNKKNDCAESSDLDLRRSTSIQHITDSRGRTSRLRSNSNMATFPLSSRHHSQSTHTLSNLAAQNFRHPVEPETEKSRSNVTGTATESTTFNSDRKRSYSSWNITSPATVLSSSGKTSLVEADWNGKEDTTTSPEAETKTAEMKVVLGANFAAEPVKPTSRCLTVRQSPSLSVSSSSTGTVTSSLSLAFVSPRPIRKLIHHLEPVGSSARPTSAAALERLDEAQRLLMRTADLSSASGDVQSRESSSPCKTLLELVRESHMSAFPSSKLAPPFPVRRSSNSWMTSSELGNTASVRTAGGNALERDERSGMWNEDGNKSAHSLANPSSMTEDRNKVVKPELTIPQLSVTPSARTALSVSTPFGTSVSRFSPSAQPQRARIGVISTPASATGTTTYSSYRNRRDHHANSLHISPEISVQNSVSQKDAVLQRSPSSTLQTQILNITSSSLSSSAAAVKAAQSNTALSSSTPRSRVTPITTQSRLQGQVQQGQSSDARQVVVYKESLLGNGFVTAALDSAIELLTSQHRLSRDATVAPLHDVDIAARQNDAPTSNVDLNATEIDYDLLDEELRTVVEQDRPRSKGQMSSDRPDDSGQLVLSSKTNGCKTVKVKDELEAIQRRRAFQIQRKDDSFERPATPDDRDVTSPASDTCRTDTLPLPRDSAIARYRRRRATRSAVTSSSSSSRDAMTSSSSSSRDTSPDRSPKTRQSPQVITRRVVRRRLHDPE